LLQPSSVSNGTISKPVNSQNVSPPPTTDNKSPDKQKAEHNKAPGKNRPGDTSSTDMQNR